MTLHVKPGRPGALVSCFEVRFLDGSAIRVDEEKLPCPTCFAAAIKVSGYDTWLDDWTLADALLALGAPPGATCSTNLPLRFVPLGPPTDDVLRWPPAIANRSFSGRPRPCPGRFRSEHARA
jgi:hypothetical protein